MKLLTESELFKTYEANSSKNMSLCNRKLFRFTFVSICMICVFGMIYYWVYKFLVEDRDIGVVDYEHIDESDMEFPVVSICIENPFLEKAIKSIDPELNRRTYLKHLKGDIYDERFEDTDYENLTLNLNDHLNAINTDFRNGSSGQISKLVRSLDITFNGFIYDTFEPILGPMKDTTNNRTMKKARENEDEEPEDNKIPIFTKCFAYQLDKKETNKLLRVTYVYDKKTVFDNLPHMKKQDRVILWIHYPGQVLLRLDTATTSMSFTQERNHKRFQISDIEFLQSRRKRKRECEVDWKLYDTIILKKHIEKHGCVAPYHTPYNASPRCKNKEQIKKYFYQLEQIREKYPQKACTRISKLGWTSSRPMKDRAWKVEIRYPNTVKTIQQSKEVDFHSLIGNVGGYVGLFLGNKTFFRQISKYIPNLFDVCDIILNICNLFCFRIRLDTNSRADYISI